MGIMRGIAAAVLGLHGLIHLMGVVAYWRLGSLPDLPYKTTVLGGMLDVGPAGIAAYGALWAVGAVGFIVAAIALLARWKWHRAAVLGVALLSLVVTALDWGVAYAGVVVNTGVLAALWLTGPRITPGRGDSPQTRNAGSQAQRPAPESFSKS